MTWVWGPPGAGKTTAVATYLSRRGAPAFWYQLDAGDADVASFFHYLREGAARTGPRLRQQLPAFSAEYLPAVGAFARRFFAALFERLPTRAVLVFDNYQEVPMEAPLHEVVREGLAQVPPDHRVIGISRAEPPPSLARLRASRAVHIVGWPALRLTLEETRSITRQLAGRPLARDTVESLHARSDGWAAGLVLMLERIKTEERIPRAQRRPAPEAVFDYFAGEIFRAASPEIQDMLLQLAFLPRVTGAMAETLTGHPNAGRRLAQLHRINYFTALHEADPPVYQFHPLFREFLLARAAEVYKPERRQAIQRAAADLLQQAGQVEDAADLLRKAEDWTALASLIRREAPNLMAQGRLHTLAAWVDCVPESVRRGDPWLLYWRCASRAYLNAPDCHQDAAAAMKLFCARGEGTGAFLAWAAGILAIAYRCADISQIDGWLVTFEELLAQFPVFESHEVEARVLEGVLLGLVVRKPDDPRLRETEARVRALLPEVGDPHLRMELAAHLAILSMWLGDFSAIRRLTGPGTLLDTEVVPSATLIMLGALRLRVSWLSGDIGAEWQQGVRIVERMRKEGIRSHLATLLGDLAAGALSRGDLSDADRWLREMASVMATPDDIGYHHYLTGWAALLRGDLVLARRAQALALEGALASGFPFIEALGRLFSAQALHACREDAEARAHLTRVLEFAERTGSALIAFPARMAEAEVAFDEGWESEGLRALAQALAVGRERGYLSTYTWRPSVMGRLCARALQVGIEVDYVRQLVKARGLVLDPPPVEMEDWPWPIKVYTLGRVAIVREGEVVQFSGKVQRRPLALLKALIALGGREVPEAQLAEALWPEAEGDAAEQALTVTLHRLRKLLGLEGVLHRQEGRLTLDSRRCWVDLWALEHLLGRAEAQARAGRDGQDRAASVRLTEQALGLYRGEFLVGEEHPWAVPTAERLRRRLSRYLGALGRRCEETHDWERAAEWYERAIGIDRAAEELHRRLIALHLRRERRAEAMLAYRRCRQALAELLGTEPSPETEALHRRLRAS